MAEVVELEHKAKILREDIIRHQFIRLTDYIERRKQLQSPAEQLRLIQQIPEVIADDVEIEVSSVPANANGVDAAAEFNRLNWRTPPIRPAAATNGSNLVRQGQSNLQPPINSNACILSAKF